jgi:hypothetical protein
VQQERSIRPWLHRSQTTVLSRRWTLGLQPEPKADQRCGRRQTHRRRIRCLAIGCGHRRVLRHIGDGRWSRSKDGRSGLYCGLLYYSARHAIDYGLIRTNEIVIRGQIVTLHLNWRWLLRGDYPAKEHGCKQKYVYFISVPSEPQFDNLQWKQEWYLALFVSTFPHP